MTDPVPCGVCGCKRIVYTTLTSNPVQWTADCPHCGFTSSHQDTKEAAILAWNSEQPVPDANGWIKLPDFLPPLGLWVEWFYIQKDLLPDEPPTVTAKLIEENGRLNGYNGLDMYEGGRYLWLEGEFQDVSHWRYIHLPTDQ